MSDAVLARCESATRVFGHGAAAVHAVRDVTCEVRARDRVAIMGPSGSGKSTLLHLLAGLDAPTSGSVTWPGIGGAAELRPAAIGIVFQGPSLMAPLDVAENVAFPLLVGGTPAAEAADAAHGALARLGLSSLARKLPEELSGGQAQRVAVARVLAGRPRLVLADEPTGQLDHASGSRVIDALLEVADHVGAAVVVTTHDVAVAARFATSWTMADGLLRDAPAVACSR
ncbi:MAG: putative transport system ATP-binding protein [Actinomycetota bacterium]|jgi:ABC-type lipoprotein export system ATPase subunit